MTDRREILKVIRQTRTALDEMEKMFRAKAYSVTHIRVGEVNGKLGYLNALWGQFVADGSERTTLAEGSSTFALGAQAESLVYMCEKHAEFPKDRFEEGFLVGARQTARPKA